VLNIEEVSKWGANFGNETALDRLAAALFVRDVEPRLRLMANFSAYFDASGDSNNKSPFVVVAGYIANYAQWKGFESVWAHVHESHNVKPPFHAADFEAALTNERYQGQNKCRQDYVELAKDKDRAKDFIQQICVAQLAMVHMGISCIVSMDVYEEANSILRFGDVIPAYALGARVCVAWIHWWQSNFDIKQPVETIFEEGDFGQGEFSNLMVSEGMEKPIFKKKKDFAGLQAADHYAWEQFYRLKQEKKDSTAPFREILGSQLDLIPKRHLQPTAEGLVNLFRSGAFNFGKIG
jgi:hypothetical protein